MWPAEKELLKLLSESIGKTVYLMPEKQYYDSQSIEATVLAIYQGIEIGNNGKPISVGAIILSSDNNGYGSFSHHQIGMTFNAMDLSTTSLDIVPAIYTPPPVSCSFDSLSDPKKVYLDKNDIYKKPLANYQSALKSNLSERNECQLQMDKNKSLIQSAVERVKNELK